MSSKIYEYIISFRTKGKRDIDQLRQSTGHAKRSTDGLKGAVRGLGKAFAAVGVLTAANALTGLAIGSAKAAMSLQQTEVAYETFLKSAEKGKQVIGSLREFSNLTPYRPEQVFTAGKALLAFNVTQKELIPTMQRIGDIASGTGKDFNELAIIYGKAKIAGTLYAEDINQLIEAGVPIIGEFAKQLGVSESQVKKMASRGLVTFPMLKKAFVDLTSDGGIFNQLMQKQSVTTAGRVSTLQGKVSDLQATMGKKLLPITNRVVDSLILLADGTKELIEPGRSQNEVLKELNHNFNIEMETLKRGNIGQEARRMLIERINKKYGEYLPNLIKEKSTLDEIALAQEKASKAMMLKIVSSDFHDELKKIREETVKAQKNIAGLDISQDSLREKMTSGKGDFVAQKHLDEMLTTSREINESISELAPGKEARVKAKYKKLADNMGIAFKEIEKGLAGTLFGKDAEAKVENSEQNKTIQNIVSGGRQITNYNISLNKFFDDLNLNVETIDEALPQLEDKFVEMLVRTLNAANGNG